MAKTRRDQLIEFIVYSEEKRLTETVKVKKAGYKWADVKDKKAGYKWADVKDKVASKPPETKPDTEEDHHCGTCKHTDHAAGIAEMHRNKKKQEEHNKKQGSTDPICAWNWVNCPACPSTCSPTSPCGGSWGGPCKPSKGGGKGGGGVDEGHYKGQDDDAEDHIQPDRNPAIPSPENKIKNFLWPLVFLKTLKGMDEASRGAFKEKSVAAYRESESARIDNTPEAHAKAYKAHKEAMSNAPIDDMKEFGMHAQHAALHYNRWKGNKGNQ